MSLILDSPTLSCRSYSTDDLDSLAYASDLSLDHQDCVFEPSFVRQLAIALREPIAKEFHTPIRPLVRRYPYTTHAFHVFIPSAHIHYTHTHAIEHWRFCKEHYCQYHTTH